MRFRLSSIDRFRCLWVRGRENAARSRFAGVLGFALLLLSSLSALPAIAAETVLHSFVPYPMGSSPQANVCLGPGNNIYGTALGGPNNNGVVFNVNNAGKETVLHGFTGGNDGGSPYSNVTCKAAGQIYGTTGFGGPSGAGVVYRMKGAGQQEVLYSFTGGNDGANPFAGVIQDAAGNLYGTTVDGGQYGAGVVFKLDMKGNETVLYSFTGGNDGGYPFGGLIQDAAGNLYGTTNAGGQSGAGVVFKLDTKLNETVLYSFTGGDDGGYPFAGVVLDSGGNLYGTAQYGGTDGAGVVFKLDAKGTETVLFTFTGGNDGGYPSAGVVLDSAGNLYGTTPYGGTAGAGVVFKLDPKLNETVLYSFTGGNDGGYPNAGVVLDKDGNLYGAASGGGMAGAGTLFMLSPNGHESVLYSFPGLDGSNPQAGVVADSAGNLYGTTNGGGTHNAGTLFQVTAGGQYRPLYTFTGGNDGSNPFGGVIMGSDGNLYGAAGGGGPFGAGLLYKMDTAGHETVLYTFTGGTDGASPNGLAIDSAGNLYGTTYFGGTSGYGVVFKIDPMGHETVLHAFTGPDGQFPMAGVTLDAHGNVYGGAWWGGPKCCHGDLYKIDTMDNFTILHGFTGPEGSNPWGDLILDSVGNLYGTTWSGGPASGDYPGVVFKVDTMSNFSVLYTFTGFSDGGGPRSNMVFDTQGNLYGTTQYGGVGPCPYFGCGVLFELNPMGQQTVLYSFSGGSDGAEPGTGLIRDAAGNLYGTTQYGGTAGAGVVYKITPGAGAELSSAASSLQPSPNAGRPTPPGCFLPHAPRHLGCPSPAPSKEQKIGPPSRP